MPINFTQLFLDSWNFMRNQYRFVLIFTLIFSLMNFASDLISQHAINAEVMKTLEPQQQVELLSQQLTKGSSLSSTLITALVAQFLSYWFFMSVHQISQRQFQGLTATAFATLPRLFGAICLSVLILMMLIVGGILFLYNWLTSASMFIPFILLIIGLILSIRLSLAPYAYLLGENVKSAVQKIFVLGKKQQSALFFYFLIEFLLFPMAIKPINQMAAHNEALSLLALVIISALQVFLLIFTYRFYSQFTQEAKQ